MINTNLFTEIDQDGIAKLSAAAQAEADFFREAKEIQLIAGEISYALWHTRKLAMEGVSLAEMQGYAEVGLTMREAAYMARLEGPVQ